jgi:xanthine dehydrogenase YagR molybdenum-binding subunit
MKPDTSGQNLPPWGETKVVGSALPRVDAYERVSGSATYSIDVAFPDMLHAAVLRCPHAHARVRRVDTAKAEKMPGVRAVIAAGAPGADIPWYPGPQGPTSRIFDPHCRYAGEEVAAVAAETPFQAVEAARAITVEYEPLPFVVTAEDALKPGAPAVQEGGNAAASPAQDIGDIAKGFAEADVVLEETYRTSCEIHATGEVHGCVARWDGDKLTVWNSSQGVFDQQEALAGALKLPLSSVRVICPYMGGGFGSKIDLHKYPVIAALLARKAARPVKLFLTREEAFLCVGNRPSDIMTLKAGVKKDGTLTALHFVNKGVVGAYPGDAGAGFQVVDLYRCPNVRIEETNVHINAGKESAMRAPGFPQCSWALEQMMDALADKIGMDPVEFRLKNIAAGSRAYGKPYTSTGLKQCLVEGAQSFRWNEARGRPPGDGPIRRGVGMAAAMWGYNGEPRAAVVVKLMPDGSVNLNMGASDIGTGAKTIMAMVVAEELSVPLDRIRIENADSATTQYAPTAGGSQTVLVNAPAVRAAAAEIRSQVLEIAAEELKRPAAELALKDGSVVPVSEPAKAVPLSQLKGLQERKVLVAVGTRHPHPPNAVALPFAAQFAEVEVNTRTGEIKVLRLVAAHDSGRVMNRLTYENQVFGGITMGVGFALTEERRLDRQTGRVVNANLHDYKLPTALDVPPEMTCLPVDPHDTLCNTTGAKGLGEPATIPTAAAIANAVYHATGVRVTKAPVTPIEMLRLLAAQRNRS